ncbi:transcriptional regulator containing PAS, AAA-type ATPase, and DNA-binding domains (plasmid) [Hoeflea sp. IMCC20628]|uniref:sigma 54-interacting transcriptional regulator n=1 Tax=Hoeflea sp. IMCC20628 TaxID=1620421 RepID=UPI00063BD332|nr:sigma 54-interacting transcriptional regulator [Hoeflea sp. IMCC20628]AKI03521.1 transcriptional regulator containing PAS, AAA-type ATPase, and DNA-binding domains [Hoeflea sp. IMCC20628]
MSNFTLADHPFFSAKSQAEAELSLEMLDDGVVLISADGAVLHMTTEAARQLGIAAEAARGRYFSDLPVKCQGWDDLVHAVVTGQATDCMLRRVDGREILAAPRSAPELTGSPAARIIVLRDLAGLDYRRERATRQAKAMRTVFIAENRTRPDFIEQRRLAPELDRVLSRGERAMLQGGRILITGESGVGKTEVAKFLHSTVADADAPFVVANCALSGDAQFARAMFGAPAAGGQQRLVGLIEQSEGGTLFLDEVAEIPLTAQALLLRFLEDGIVSNPDGGEQRVVNVRVIAATNRDLRQMVREGRFRADLYYRLAVVPLRVPPLRDMPALIDHLTGRFLQTINQRRQAALFVPRRVREMLGDYSFPGNIRELLNIVQKLSIFLEEVDDLAELMADLLAPIDIPGLDAASATAGQGVEPYDLRSEVRRYERTLIDKAIRLHGSKRKAANALGVDIGTIVRKTADPTAETSTATTAKTYSGEPKT